MKNEIKIFFAGVCSCLVAVLAFILGRKKGMADGDGIRSDNYKHDDSAERIERIEAESEERIERAENAITDTIRILQEARERAEKENSSV